MMESYGRQEERLQQKARRNAEQAKAARLEEEARKATVIPWSTNKLPQSTSHEASSIHDHRISQLLPDFQKLKQGSIPTVNGHGPRKAMDEAEASQARKEDRRIRELATSSMRRSSSDQLLNGHLHAQNGPSKPNMFSVYLKNPQSNNRIMEEPRKNGVNGRSRASRFDQRENETSNEIPELHELTKMIREITSISTSNPEITPLNSPIYMQRTHLPSPSRSLSPIDAEHAAKQLEADLALSESSEDEADREKEEGEIETIVRAPGELHRSDQSASSGIGSDSQTLSHIEPTSDEDQGFNFNLHEWHQKINDKLTPVNQTPSPVVRPASSISGNNPLTPATSKALASSERSSKSVYDEASNSSPQSPLPEIQLHSVPALPMSPPPPSPPSPERSFGEEEAENEEMEDTISDQMRISLKARGKRKSDGGRSDFTVSFALSMIDRLPSVSKYGHKITHEESSSKRKEDKSKKQKEPSFSQLANKVFLDSLNTSAKEAKENVVGGVVLKTKKEETKKQPIKIKLRKPTLTSPSELFSDSTQPSPVGVSEPAEALNMPVYSNGVTKKAKDVETTKEKDGKESKKRKTSADDGRKGKKNDLGGLFTPDVPSPKPRKSKGKKNEERKKTDKATGKKEKSEKTTVTSVPPVEKTTRRTPSPLRSDAGMPSPLHIPAGTHRMPSPLNLSVSQRMPTPLTVDRLKGSTSPPDEPDSSLPVDLSVSRKETGNLEEPKEETSTKERRSERSEEKDSTEEEKDEKKEKEKNSPLLEEVVDKNPPEERKASKEKKKQKQQEDETKEREEEEKADQTEKTSNKDADIQERILAATISGPGKVDDPVVKEKDKKEKSNRSPQDSSRKEREDKRERRRSSRDRERRKRERSRSRERRSRSRSRDVRRRREASPTERSSNAPASRKRSRDDEDDAKVAVAVMETVKKTDIIKPKKPVTSSESVLDKLMADRRIPSPDHKEGNSEKKPSSENNTPVKASLIEVEKTKEEFSAVIVTNGFHDGASRAAKWDAEHAALKSLDMKLDHDHQKTLGKIVKDEAGLMNDKSQFDVRAVVFLQSVVHFALMARAMEKASPATSRSVYEGTVIFCNQPISKDPPTLLLKMAKVLQLRTQAIFAFKNFKLVEEKVVAAQRACEKYKKTVNEAARARTPAQAKTSTAMVSGKSPGSPGKVASPYSVGSSGSQGSADVPRSSQVAPSSESPVSAVSTVPTSNEVSLPSCFREHYDLTQSLHHAHTMWRKSKHMLEDGRKLDAQVGHFDAWLQSKAPLTSDSSIEALSQHLYVALWVLRKLN